jgi:hypothetical protein
MNRRFLIAGLFAGGALLAQLGYKDTPLLPGGKWRVHDIDRPRPVVVTPAPAPGAPPSDAIVLFDGKDLSRWNGNWTVKDGYIEVPQKSNPKTDLISKEKFGDIQLHVEFATPNPPFNEGQNRGNSGIIFMGRYELQVLDSHNSPTYADGQAGAVYGQFPPLVNAIRPPGEWQTYDIIFEAPRFEGGYVKKQAHVTALLNGVVVQAHRPFIGQMAHRVIRQYEPHEPEQPLLLQNHNEPVRYRNIWVRRLNLNQD